MFPPESDNPYMKIVAKNPVLGDIFRTHEYALSDYLLNGFPTFKRVLFFDDSVIHVNGVYENCSYDVCSVYIPSRYTFHLNMDHVDHHVDHRVDYSGNLYVKNIEDDDDFDLNSIAEDDGYRSNGLTKRFSTALEPHTILPSCLDRIHEWVDKSDHLKGRMVFFDWDYVLNQQNGFVIVKSSGDGSHFRLLHDTLLYLFGGEERLVAIQNLLQRLLDHKIDIFIITSNGNANPADREVRRRFVELLQLLFKYRYFNDARLIYVSERFYGTKYAAIGKFSNVPMECS